MLRQHFNHECLPCLVSKPAPKVTAPVAPNRALNASKPSANNATNQAIEDLSNQLMDMRLNLEGLEKERDFYFSKLRDIEILCQEADEGDAAGIIAKILDILYATEVSWAEFSLFRCANVCFSWRMVSRLPMNWPRKRKSIKPLSSLQNHLDHSRHQKLTKNKAINQLTQFQSLEVEQNITFARERKIPAPKLSVCILTAPARASPMKSNQARN